MNRLLPLVFGLVSIFLGSCSAAPSATVLDVWAMGREGEVIGDLVPEFERENPGVKVRIQQLPFTAGIVDRDEPAAADGMRLRKHDQRRSHKRRYQKRSRVRLHPHKHRN